jgi:predicted nuclease of predicted toxin-antitoxin system
MDVHIRRAIIDGLRECGVDVTTAREDGTDRLPDPELLDRASTLGCVLVTGDDDLLVEAANRQRSGRGFAGVVFFRQTDPAIRRRLEELELLAQIYEPHEFEGRVEFLPLQ